MRGSGCVVLVFPARAVSTVRMRRALAFLALLTSTSAMSTDLSVAAWTVSGVVKVVNLLKIMQGESEFEKEQVTDEDLYDDCFSVVRGKRYGQVQGGRRRHPVHR